MLDELLVALGLEAAKGFGEIKNLQPFYIIAAIVAFTNWCIYMIGLFSIVRFVDKLLFRRKRPTRPVITARRPAKD